MISSILKKLLIFILINLGTKTNDTGIHTAIINLLKHLKLK